jgi:DNA-binding NtrC family response regulator
VRQPAPQPAASRRSAKILVAEDDVLVRLALAEALRQDGFQVLEAAEMSEAIAILKSAPDVDVVISDMAMRDAEDGIALAGYVRRHHPEISLLLASAHGHPRISGALFDGFFAKPYSAREIVAWIRRRVRPTSMPWQRAKP